MKSCTKNPMSERAKKRLDQLYRYDRKRVADIVERLYRVVDTRGASKPALISMIMEAEFSKKELGWEKNPAPRGYTLVLSSYDMTEVREVAKGYRSRGKTFKIVTKQKYTWPVHNLYVKYDDSIDKRYPKFSTENPASGEKTLLQCQFCKKLFWKKIGPKTYEIKCPKCGEYDVMPVNYFGKRKNPSPRKDQSSYYWTAINENTGEIVESFTQYSSPGTALRYGISWTKQTWKTVIPKIEVWNQPYRYSENLKIEPVLRIRDRKNPFLADLGVAATLGAGFTAGSTIATLIANKWLKKKKNPLIYQGLQNHRRLLNWAKTRFNPAQLVTHRYIITDGKTAKLTNNPGEQWHRNKADELRLRRRKYFLKNDPYSNAHWDSFNTRVIENELAADASHYLGVPNPKKRS